MMEPKGRVANCDSIVGARLSRWLNFGRAQSRGQPSSIPGLWTTTVTVLAIPRRASTTCSRLGGLKPGRRGGGGQCRHRDRDPGGSRAQGDSDRAGGGHGRDRESGTRKGGAILVNGRFE